MHTSINLHLHELLLGFPICKHWTSSAQHRQTGNPASLFVLPSTAGQDAGLESPARRWTPAPAARSLGEAGSSPVAPRSLRPSRLGAARPRSNEPSRRQLLKPGGQKAGPLPSRHGGGRDRAALPPRLQAPPKAGAAPCDGGEAGTQSGVGAALLMKLCPWLSTQNVPPLSVALCV